MLSMTGFGQASLQGGSARFDVEIRSLNNKYLKVLIKLPDEFQSLEAELDARVRKHLSRGTVTLKAACTKSSAAATLNVNHESLDHYVKQIRQSESVASGDITLDIASLLGLPGVLVVPDDALDRLDQARQAFFELTDQACAGLIAMRQTEGLALVTELLDLKNLITERLALIEQRSPLVVQEYEQRLQSRIKTLLEAAEIPVEPMDVIREIAVYAERTDINEEVSRLKGHIEQFTEMVTAQDRKPIGRTLDFLAQEMLREANTIASKSSDAQTSRAVVEVKGAIDRIKEQVQNVE